jgi:hypothetical protein
MLLECRSARANRLEIAASAAFTPGKRIRPAARMYVAR